MDVLLACAVICTVLWWIRHNQLYMSGQVKTPFFSFGSKGSTRRVRVAHRPVSKRSSNQVSGEMLEAIRRVAVYTHDAEVAARLLHSTRQSNMSKSINWCTEKTIEDIIRDRR
jgi:hypothetical protein